MTNTEETYSRCVNRFQDWLEAQPSPSVTLAAIKRYLSITERKDILQHRPARNTIPLSQDEARHAFQELKSSDLTYWIILRLVYELGVMPAFLLGHKRTGAGLQFDDIIEANGHTAIMVKKRGTGDKFMYVLRGQIELDFKYWLDSGYAPRRCGFRPERELSIFGVTKYALWYAQKKVIEKLQRLRVIRPEIRAGASTIFRKSPALRVSDDARARDMGISA